MQARACKPRTLRPAPSRTLRPAPSRTLRLAPSRTLRPAPSRTLRPALSRALRPVPTRSLLLLLQDLHLRRQREQVVRQVLVDRDAVGVHLEDLLAVAFPLHRERPHHTAAHVAILGKAR